MFVDTGVVGIDASGNSVKRLRLNINIHGMPENVYTSYQGKMIAKEVEKYAATGKFDLSKIEGIRLISCHGGEASNTATYLADYFKRPVKSYMGKVSSYRPQFPEMMTDASLANNNYVAKPWRTVKTNTNVRPVHYQVRMVAPDGSQLAHYHYVNGAKVNLP
jgi:hypothetical protein